MIRYRPFLNHDPPAIAEIWRGQPPRRGLVQPMSPQLFEQHVLSKCYFDRFGLILALDDDQPVGIVHAGFGARADLATLGSEQGATCLLLTVPRPDQEQIAAELLAQGEEYLRQRGVREWFGGPAYPVNPFYLGLYGGSEQNGILASDAATCELYRRSGYEEARRSIVLQRGLAGFRPTVDRRQMQLRRQYQVEPIVDPPTANWWEACLWGETERTRFNLCQRGGGAPLGHVMLWDMQPLAGSWGVRAAGLTELEILTTTRRQGLALFLLGETFRQLLAQGVTLVEVQVSQDNRAALNLYAKLGFEEVDQGIVFRKRAGE